MQIDDLVFKIQEIELKISKLKKQIESTNDNKCTCKPKPSIKEKIDIEKEIIKLVDINFVNNLYRNK